MGVLQVTSREFREKQKMMLDLVDQGEKIIILRGKKKAYTLIPVEDNDLNFTSKMTAKISQAVKEIKKK